MFERIIERIRALYPGQGPIPLHQPGFCGREWAYVRACLDSSYVSTVSPYVEQFEAQLAAYTGARFAVATVSGTAALHVALLAAGVKTGDLVLTQPLAFVAASHAVAYVGATPVYLDVERSTLGLDPDRVAAFLRSECTVDHQGACVHRSTGQRVAACVPVHTFGHPARLAALVAACEAYHVPVIEDAAEALGSTYQGQHAGTFGMLGVYSFNGNKIVTAGGGGAVVTHDETLAARVRHLTTQAKLPHPWECMHDEVGYNYRMPGLNAALARAQMEQVENFVADKRQTAASYAQCFDDLGIPFVSEPPESRANYWLNAILLPDRTQRDAFLRYSHERGVMTRPAWELMPRLPAFAGAIVGEIPCAEEIYDRLINLPSSVRHVDAGGNE